MSDHDANPEQLDIYTLTNLEQVKVLADPLRVRILEVLCDSERTTKQVAELLGEKPTRLYHHVEALERVGLIRLTSTRQNRGMVEKYYLAVARLFKAEPTLFQSPSAEHPDIADLVTTLLDANTREIKRLIEAGHDFTDTSEGLLSFIEIRATQQQIEHLTQRLLAAVEEFAAVCDDEPPPEDCLSYRLTVAFFPKGGPTPEADDAASTDDDST